MKTLAASRPPATISSVGAWTPLWTRSHVDSVDSASTIMIATSSPAMRPATTMSNTAFSSWLCVGKPTHWPSIRATRVAPTGPVNGRPEICVDAEAALIASTSYGVSGLSARTVMTTWTSLRRPFLKVGRSGRSIRRQVRIASSDGTALTTEERARDAARGVHPLLDVDRQREEVELVLGVLAGRGGRQQHRVVVEEGGDASRRPAGRGARSRNGSCGCRSVPLSMTVSTEVEFGHGSPFRRPMACLCGTRRRAGGASGAGLRSRPAGSRMGVPRATTEDRARRAWTLVMGVRYEVVVVGAGGHSGGK